MCSPSPTRPAGYAARVRYAIFDTNAFTAAPWLGANAWRDVLDAIDIGTLTAAVPRVCLIELDRQATVALTKLSTTLTQWTGQPLPSDVPVASTQPLLSKFAIVDLPNIAHEQLLVRSAARGKPFDANGNGYQDALVWQSVIDWAETLPAGSHLTFVTDDTHDFPTTDDGSLHADLFGDVPAHVTIVIARGLHALRADLAAAATGAKALEQRVKAWAEAAMRGALAQQRRGDIGLGVHLEDASITHIGDPASTTANQWDADADHTYWEVEVEAEVEIEATVFDDDDARSIAAFTRLQATRSPAHHRPTLYGPALARAPIEVVVAIDGETLISTHVANIDYT